MVPRSVVVVVSPPAGQLGPEGVQEAPLDVSLAGGMLSQPWETQTLSLGKPGRESMARSLLGDARDGSAPAARRRRYGKAWLAGVALVLATAVVAWVVIKAREADRISDPGKSRGHGEPIPIRTAFVEEKLVDEVIGATALTEPSEMATIQVGPSRQLASNDPISDVVIKAVHVHEGDQVRAGQVLFDLDDQVFGRFINQRATELASAKVALELSKQQTTLNQRVRDLTLEKAKEEVNFRKEDLANKKQAYDIFAKLYRDGGAASVLEYWASRALYAQAQYAVRAAELDFQIAKNTVQVGQLQDQKDLAQAQAVFAAAEFNLGLARRDLARCQIRSPLAGFVDQVHIVPGSLVSLSTALTNIYQLAPIHVRLDLPQERIDDVAVGQKADVVLDSYPRETFTGTVIRISPKVNAQLRVLPVVVALQNPGQRIKAGISGYVRVHVNRKARTVPALALYQQGPKTVVFQVQQGRAVVREVTAGPLVQNGVQEVRAALAPGDEVVIYASDFYKHYGDAIKHGAYLNDGDVVSTEWRKWTRRD